MDPAVWIAMLVGLVLLAGSAWLVLVETSIVVDPGTIVLLLKRGKATGRALEPGRHFVPPWRKIMVQVYPSRELVLVAGGRAAADVRVEYVDEPLRLHLGDRAFVKVSYTVRCRLDTGKLRDVHNAYGPEGVWPALRDATRGALLGEAGGGKLAIDDVFGDQYSALERRFTGALDKALEKVGFALVSFTLREIDLGEIGDVIQATVRADAELGHEQAVAKVRKARLENDAAMNDLLAGVDGDVMLRYRQIEAWRDILGRWDGDRSIPPALIMPLLATPPAFHDESVDEPNDGSDIAVDGRE